MTILLIQINLLVQPPSIPYDSHPERPGEPDCPVCKWFYLFPRASDYITPGLLLSCCFGGFQYFLKTQKCKFGLNCKFNHPKDILVKLELSTYIFVYPFYWFLILHFTSGLLRQKCCFRFTGETF